MIELSTTWVNRAEANLVPVPARAAAADTTHSPTRLDAVYTSGGEGRSALPVDAVTTSGTPAPSAAAITFLTPSTLVVTVRWTSCSARPGSRWAATWNSTSGLVSPTTAATALASRTSAWANSAPSGRGQPPVSPRDRPMSRRGR
jgi:hypothetical protein